MSLNNKEIIVKAFRKCKLNVQSYFHNNYFVGLSENGDIILESLAVHVDAEGIYNEYPSEFIVSINVIIFSHSFAKAFWGEEKYTGIYCWQHHLQMMVLEEEPLKYLEKWL
jgi:hypothetical protein